MSEALIADTFEAKVGWRLRVPLNRIPRRHLVIRSRPWNEVRMRNQKRNSDSFHFDVFVFVLDESQVEIMHAELSERVTFGSIGYRTSQQIELLPTTVWVKPYIQSRVPSAPHTVVKIEEEKGIPNKQGAVASNWSPKYIHLDTAVRNSKAKEVKGFVVNRLSTGHVQPSENVVGRSASSKKLSAAARSFEPKSRREAAKPYPGYH